MNQAIQKKTLFSTQSLVIMAMFTAVLCIFAYISIPLPNGSHLTLFNLVLLLIALVFPLGQALTIVVVWLLLGIVGLPVFFGGVAGIGYLISPLGGYALGFVPTVILLPLLRGKNYNRIRFTAMAIVGAVLIDIVGTLQWMLLGHLSLQSAIVAGFLPFIVLDLVKAVVAAQIAPALSQPIAAANERGRF